MAYKTRKQKIAAYSGPLEDGDGLCLRHNQKMYLEPCYKCQKEIWDDKEHELKCYRNTLKTILKQLQAYNLNNYNTIIPKEIQKIQTMVLETLNKEY